MASRSRRPWKIRTKLVVMLGAINVLGTALFAGLAYTAASNRSLTDIDEALCAAADGAQQIVPSLIINDVDTVGRDTPAYVAAYRDAHRQLEQYAEAARVEFIYAIVVRPDGTAFELMGNLSPEQQAERADPLVDLFRKPYAPSPAMLTAARTMSTTIDAVEDSYGYFRSCLEPVRWSNGLVVMFGADLNITDVRARLRQDLIVNFGIGAIVMVLTLTFVLVFSRRIASELGDVVTDANRVSRLQLDTAAERRQSTTLEVDRLFAALHDMKAGLRAFSKYVPNAVIGRVLETGKAEIGGERRELSLLMTDVADFTTISEQLDPEKVMVVMSEYFDHVVAPLLAEGATVDKYVGDAIFSYWNAPHAQSDHAARCCRAALRARAVSMALADQWRAAGRWPWITRFGLHSGATVFGNVGAPDRMDFTVIGGSVNLASRLEGLNKVYGTSILASDALRANAGDRFLFRPVDRVMPKGVVAPVDIFELIGAFGVADLAPAPADVSYVEAWDAAYTAYRRREFTAARGLFAALAAERPADALAGRYLARATVLADQPPPIGWDGVERFDNK
ncbi:MAG: adenylate/guanylate cyclase domain-containing protein [Rhodospirillaceae bacterium]|nr:adenylate/guanylate cyclase domain-containing protein [Rhodospirillaceae bacterium]